MNAESPSNKLDKAYVVTVSMGYGHRRPAHTLRTIAATPPGWTEVDFPVAGSPLIVANDYSGIPDSDRRSWSNGRTMYETISKYRNIPAVGQIAWAIMDYLQRIEDIDTNKDLTKPTLQLRSIYKLINNGFGKHLIEWLNEDPKPLITTFFTVAFFAEEHGYKGDIYCICTDSDVSRAWAPLDATNTRINYLAPSKRVYERLQKYGVPKKQISFTGFPLPDELVAVDDARANALQRARQARLSDASQPLTIMYPVGGAGAQTQTAFDILDSCRSMIEDDALRMILVAGSRPEVRDSFVEELTERNLQDHNNIEVVFHENTFTMFEEFNTALEQTDILWTKPSELSFFAALGLPIMMTKPLGAQEVKNRDWLLAMDAGLDQQDPANTAEWLMKLRNSGRLAEISRNGFAKAPRHGLYNILQQVGLLR